MDHHLADFDGAATVGSGNRGVTDAADERLLHLPAAVCEVEGVANPTDGGIKFDGHDDESAQRQRAGRAIRPTKASAKFAHLDGAAMVAFATGALLRDSPVNMEPLAA